MFVGYVTQYPLFFPRQERVQNKIRHQSSAVAGERARWCERACYDFRFCCAVASVQEYSTLRGHGPDTEEMH